MYILKHYISLNKDKSQISQADNAFYIKPYNNIEALAKWSPFYRHNIHTQFREWIIFIWPQILLIFFRRGQISISSGNSVLPNRWKVITWLILGLYPANVRRRYKVIPSLIGWAQT